jgi:hypothetical protein
MEYSPVCLNRLVAPLIAAAMSALPLGHASYAELPVKVDKSAQRVTVALDGTQLYDWSVTTGGLR